MATSLAITLPMPPSINGQYVTVGRRRVLSKDAKQFHKDVTRLIETARKVGALSPSTEAAIQQSLLGVYLTFYFETPFRRDLDGGLKIALDALCVALGIDDRTVVDLHLSKQIDPLQPRLEIEMEAIEGWTFDREYVLLGEEHRGEGRGARGGERVRVPKGRRGRRPGWPLDAAIVVALLVVTLWRLLPAVDRLPFHRDEARWIGNAALLREWRHPLGILWQDEGYEDRYGSIDAVEASPGLSLQPPCT